MTEALLDPFELNQAFPVGILSPSSISTYLKCPEWFRRQYVKDEKRERGAWAVSGTAFHEARHMALAWQMEHGQSYPEEKIGTLFEEAWQASLREGAAEWRGTTPEKQREIAWGMFDAYQHGLGKSVIPVAMEEWVKTYVEGVPVPVLGKVDVVTRSPSEVIDTKTGRQLFHQMKDEHMIQGSIYCLATNLPVRWHSVSEKPAASTNENLRLDPTPKVLNAARAYVKDVYEGVRRLLDTRGTDEPWPLHGPASGQCKYCSARKTCVGYLA